MPMIFDNATLSPIIINEYDNVTLQCQARGRPKPYITWFRLYSNENDEINRIDSNKTILANTTDGQLHLYNVTRHESDHYECRASNGVKEHVVSKDIELRVLCKYILYII